MQGYQTVDWGDVGGCPKNSAATTRSGRAIHYSLGLIRRVGINSVAQRSHFIKEKRRGWDLNPRWSYPHSGFRDRPVQPLQHLSGITATDFLLYVTSE